MSPDQPDSSDESVPPASPDVSSDLSPGEPPRSTPPWWAERSDDDDHRPPAARGPGSRRGFGLTWWGRAWIDALEHRAALDPGRLARGRSYARRGAVGTMRVAPGLVMASVQGSRALPYTVTVRVPTFSRDEWARVLDAVGAQIGRTAALLDGELPPELVDDMAGAGLDLLPGAGEIEPRCSCPDWAEPCKHGAAVCYLIADHLDDDPFALLLLRGRSRADVLADLRARRAALRPTAESAGAGAGHGGADGPAYDPDVDGVVARDAYRRAAADRPDIPVPPLPPSRPAQPFTVMFDPPPASGIDPDALRTLASDAARRAWRLATDDGARPEPL